MRIFSSPLILDSIIQPPDPITGQTKLFIDFSDGKLKSLKSDGTLINLEAGGGGGVSAPLVLVGTDPSTTPFVVKGAASQATTIFEYQDNNNTPIIFGDLTGTIYLRGPFGSKIDINAPTSCQGYIQFRYQTAAIMSIGTDTSGSFIFYDGHTEPISIVPAGDMVFNPGGVTKVTSTFVISPPSVPSSASDTGTTGTISWDSSFIYVCVATNTWKRSAISTW